jgi:hypothetical protein
MNDSVIGWSELVDWRKTDRSMLSKQAIFGFVQNIEKMIDC